MGKRWYTYPKTFGTISVVLAHLPANNSLSGLEKKKKRGKGQLNKLPLKFLVHATFHP